jgi:hypothetical protein
VFVSEVSNLGATSKPAFLISSVLLERINTGKKSIVEEGVTLSHVNDINCQWLALGKAPNSEEEPLGIALGVYVILQKQVILRSANLYLYSALL